MSANDETGVLEPLRGYGGRPPVNLLELMIQFLDGLFALQNLGRGVGVPET